MKWGVMSIFGGTSTPPLPRKSRPRAAVRVFFALLIIFLHISAADALTVSKAQILEMRLVSLSTLLSEAQGRQAGKVCIKLITSVNVSCSIDPIRNTNFNLGLSVDFFNLVESLFKAGDSYNMIKNKIIDGYTTMLKQINDVNQTIKIYNVYRDVKKETVDFMERLKIDERLLSLEGSITGGYQKILASQVELYILSGIDVQFESISGADMSLQNITNRISTAYTNLFSRKEAK